MKTTCFTRILSVLVAAACSFTQCAYGLPPSQEYSLSHLAPPSEFTRALPDEAAKLLGLKAKEIWWEIEARMHLRRKWWIAGNTPGIPEADKAIPRSGQVQAENVPYWEDSSTRSLSLWRLHVLYADGSQRLLYCLMRNNEALSPAISTQLRTAVSSALQEHGIAILAARQLPAFLPQGLPASSMRERRIKLISDRLEQLVGPLRVALEKGYRKMSQMRGLPGFPAFPAITTFLGSASFLTYVKNYLQGKVELIVMPVEQVNEGVLYRQSVGYQDRAGVYIPRFELRVEALGTSFLITDKKHLKELETYQMVIHSLAEGRTSHFFPGKSLPFALGSMNAACQLFSQGHATHHVADFLRQSLRLSSQRILFRQELELGWGHFPDVAVYTFMPRGPSTDDDYITHQRNLLLARFAKIMRSWSGQLSAEYCFIPEEKSAWTQALEGMCRMDQEKRYADALDRALKSSNLDNAWEILLRHDPLWASRLQALPGADKRRILDVHARALPALQTKIRELFKDLHDHALKHPQTTPLLEHMQHIFSHGDAWKRRGYAAVQCFMIERGFIQGKALDFSQEEQIVWGLQYLLEKKPEEFDGHVRILGISKPLQSAPPKSEHYLRVLSYRDRTQMGYSELQKFFQNLSVADDNTRRLNLMNMVKLGSIHQFAGELIFKAMASTVEEFLAEKDGSLTPLLGSLRTLVHKFHRPLAAPFFAYLREPEGNPVVKNIFIALFSETGNDEVANELLAMVKSGQFWDTLPRELLVRGILRSGDAACLAGLFEDILTRRSARAMQEFIAAWPLAAHNVLDFKALSAFFDKSHEALQKRQLSHELQLSLGMLYLRIASTLPENLKIFGNTQPSLRQEFDLLRRRCVDESLTLLHELWKSAPAEIREQAAENLLRHYRTAGNAVEAASWEKHLQSLHEAKTRVARKRTVEESAGRLFLASPFVEALAQQAVVRPSLFVRAINAMRIDYVHRLDSLWAGGLNLRVTLVRTSLTAPEKLFKDFLLIHQQSGNHDVGRILFAFVRDRQKPGVSDAWRFVQLPASYWPSLQRKVEKFPWQRILPVPPSELRKSTQILIPFYLLQGLDTAHLDQARHEISRNLMTGHLLKQELLDGVTACEGLLWLYPQKDLIGAHFPISRSVMKPLGNATGIGEFAHELLHDVYIAGLSFDQRVSNRAYFTGTFRGEQHPLLGAIRKPYADVLNERSDALYSEALAFTAQALAAWRTHTHLQSPVLYSDIDHLDRLGLLPPAMRLEPLGLPVTDTPIGAEYYRLVLRALQQQAQTSHARQDIEIAAYHQWLLLSSGSLPEPLDTRQIEDVLSARFWRSAMRQDVEQRVLNIASSSHWLGLIARHIRAAERRLNTPLPVRHIWVTGNLFGKRAPTRLEFVVGVQGQNPARPIKFSDSGRSWTITVVGSETPAFDRIHALRLWRNSVLLLGVKPASVSANLLRDHLALRLKKVKRRMDVPRPGARWSEMLQEMLELSLRLHAIAPDMQGKDNLGPLAQIVEDFDGPISPEQETALQALLPLWVQDGMATVASLDAPPGASSALLGRQGQLHSSDAIVLAKEAALEIPPEKQKELTRLFQNALSAKQRQALASQGIELIFSSGFKTLMAREGNRVYVERKLLPSQAAAQNPPAGMRMDQYWETRQALYRMLLAHELRHKEFSWEEELFAVCDELLAAWQFAHENKSGDGPDNLRRVLVHLGLNPYGTSIDEFVELAQEINHNKWHRPHLINPIALRKIIPFAAKYYPAILPRNFLNATGQTDDDKIKRIFDMLDNGRLQWDEAYRQKCIAGQAVRRLHAQDWPRLIAAHQTGPLPKEFFLSADVALRRQPALMDADGLPMLYRFALAPETWTEIAAAARRNSDLRRLLLSDRAMSAAHRDFLRQSRLFPGNPLRQPLEFKEVLAREEAAGLRPLLDLPLDDARATILDAAGGFGTLLAGSLEGLTAKGHRTACVTVSDRNASVVQGGRWLRRQSKHALRMDYQVDDLAASAIKPESMDAVLLKNFVSTLPLAFSTEANTRLMLAFAHINRILRDKKSLTIIDLEENAPLLKYLVGLYGFRLESEQKAPSMLYAQSLVVLRAVKERPMPLLEGVCHAGLLRAQLNRLQAKLAGLLSRQEVEFTLSGTPHKIPKNNAFESILSGLARGQELILRIPGEPAFRLALQTFASVQEPASPMPIKPGPRSTDAILPVLCSL